MANITYSEIEKLAEQLPETEQNKLIYHLRAKQTARKLPEQHAALPENTPVAAELSPENADYNPAREALMQKFAALRASGAFEHVESLYGKYSSQALAEMSSEELHAEIHAIATEWEEELEEYNPSSD